VCTMTARQVSTRCSPRSSNPMRNDRTGAVMSKEELRTRLLGTWQLVSSVVRFTLLSQKTLTASKSYDFHDCRNGAIEEVSTA
jgi:hypothetical protein